MICLVQTEKFANGSANGPYPWLESNDSQRYLTDEKILEKYLFLSQSQISLSMKKRPL